MQNRHRSLCQRLWLHASDGKRGTLDKRFAGEAY